MNNQDDLDREHSAQGKHLVDHRHERLRALGVAAKAINDAILALAQGHDQRAEAHIDRARHLLFDVAKP